MNSYGRDMKSSTTSFCLRSANPKIKISHFICALHVLCVYVALFVVGYKGCWSYMFWGTRNSEVGENWQGGICPLRYWIIL